MTKEMAQKWVDALRSGKYKQGKNYLRYSLPNKEDRFCCLGVLCDISGLGEWRETNKRVYVYSYKKEEEKCFLPILLAKRLGITENPFLSGFDAISRNDDGQSFDTIADAIEKEYLND